jgi:hypothetical protein
MSARQMLYCLSHASAPRYTLCVYMFSKKVKEKKLRKYIKNLGNIK